MDLNRIIKLCNCVFLACVFTAEVIGAPSSGKPEKQTDKPDLSAITGISGRAHADSLSYYNSIIEKSRKDSMYYQQLIIKERKQLINDIQTMRRIFPLSQYNGEILLRLAELNFEQETYMFEMKLDQWQQDMEKAEAGGKNADLPFPELKYDKTIAVYNEILNSPFYTSEHPDAIYYKALCLIQLKDEDGAIELMGELVRKFPESDFYLPGLIKMGDYYFNRPFSNGGQGYNIAIDLYKKAISETKQPYFNEAMYKLGWSYFQQDRYRDAVAVFKSLIENSDLDFSETSGTKFISNPLLRDEAIEFLAVSLDESGDFDEAENFLQMIGSDDYASKVLLKLSEIYITRSNFNKSNQVLESMIENHYLGLKTPMAKLRLVKNYQLLGDRSNADRHLGNFFDSFGKGSKWYLNNRDADMKAYVDSQAIKILISTTEKILQQAKQTGDRELYIQVAKNYSRLIEQYPNRRETYTTEWNLALILDKYINNPANAYYNYMRVATAYPYTEHRREALLSAIAVMQRVWESGQASIPEDTSLSELALDTNLTSIEKDIIAAAQKFGQYYEKDAELEKVAMIEASIYFNRRLFGRAIPIYAGLLKRKPRPENAQEITRMLAQSYMGQNNYVQAEKWFGKLAESSAKEEYKKAGEEGQVEAAYRAAEKLEKAGKFEEAGKAYAAIAKKYATATLADVAQFTAAEAFEKAGNYKAAARAYIDLSRLFPSSKYADGALFNAASNYEKDKDYANAIKMYEDLISRFPNSAHVRNALFNISLCYEKLQDFEKVAQANERYASMFPQEKDAPDMLYSTGKFYMKAGQYEKALAVFRRFYTKYIGTDRELESRFYTGQCYLEMGDDRQAEEVFKEIIARTALLTGQGKNVSNYYASRSQMEIAGIYRSRYYEVKLLQPEKELSAAKKRKTELLKNAANAYQKVIEYKNQNAVKAAYHIGSLYEDFAVQWKDQERPADLSPTKQTILEKKMLTAAIKLLKQSVPFYEKSAAFKAGTDTSQASEEIRMYIDSAKTKLQRLEIEVAKWTLQSAYVILNNPVPENLQKDPLTNYVYKIKLLETTKKDFKKALDLYQTLWNKSKTDQKLQAYSDEIRETYSKENFLYGARFVLIADEMLNYSFAGFNSLNEEELENYQFQLEDLAFESQDQALPMLIESWRNAQTDGLNDLWSRQIFQLLRRLDPQNYHAPENVRKIVITSGPQWWAGSQSFPGWNSDLSDSVTSQIFGPVTSSSLSRKVTFPGKAVAPMWSPEPHEKLFFRKLFTVAGSVKSAVIDITAEENFILYINGKEIYNDKETEGDFVNIRSFNIGDLIKRGVNLVAVAASSKSEGKGVVIRMVIDEDTSGVAKSSLEPAEQLIKPAETAREFQPKTMDELKAEYADREIYRKNLLDFQKRNKTFRREIRSEKNKILRTRNQLEKVKKDIKNIEKELEYYNQKMNDLKR